MKNEKRLIDANAFKMYLEQIRQDYLEEDTLSSNFAAEVIETVQDEYLKNAPTVDAVVLPCKIGDMVYSITYCRCGNPECYDKRHCHKKETARTPKVLASKMVQQMGRKYNWKNFAEQNWEWKPCGTICYRVYQKPFELKMLVEVGKTVFLSLEEAKRALANFGAKMDGGSKE